MKRLLDSTPRILAFSFVFLLLGASQIGFADDSEDSQTLLTPSDPITSNLEIHGFLSQGYVQSTGNNFLPNSTQGTTKFTEAGITVNKQLTSDLRAGFQIFASDYGATDQYQAMFDWFLIDYHWRDWLGVRAGRIKLPFGLFNDTSDIDAARDPILLPQSTYPIQNRNYLLAQTGVELYGYANLKSAGGLEYRFYRGTIQVDSPAAPNEPLQLINVQVPYVFGGRIIWDTPVSGLRAGVSAQQLMLDADVYVPALSQTSALNLPITMAIGSVEYVHKSFQFVAEYSKWWIRTDSANTAVFPDVGETSEKYYAMINYHVKPWLRPGIYYSASFPDETLRTNSENVWHDYAGYVRFDLYSNWLFKLEAHYMDGTAGLDTSLNGGQQLSALPRDWWLFLAKTTVTF